MNHLRTLRSFQQWKDYSFSERNYQLIFVVTKIAFAAIVVAGLFQKP
jgi:hypothetical protein